MALVSNPSSPTANARDAWVSRSRYGVVSDLRARTKRGSPEDLPLSRPLGASLPQDDPHAISVSLPTWQHVNQYMAGDTNVHAKLESDYPRFYQHRSVQRLNDAVLTRLQMPRMYHCAISPSRAATRRFRQLLQQKCKAGQRPEHTEKMHEVFFHLSDVPTADKEHVKWAQFGVLLYPESCTGLAAEVWAHTGDGICSRQAEYCIDQLDFMQSVLTNGMQNLPACGLLSSPAPFLALERSTNSLKRSPWPNPDGAIKAKLRARIARYLISQNLDQPSVDPERDVYLFPKGMCAIGQISRLLVPATSAPVASEAVVFGWLYGSTPKAVQMSGYERFTLYYRGAAAELDELEESLRSGTKISALFCEIPSNPLCASPDLHRIRRLADTYHFIVVVDETIGTFVNVDVLPYADILVTSLTKMFSGACNVMGGSVVLNSRSSQYGRLKSLFDDAHEDKLFPLDAAMLLDNSADFTERVHRANDTAAALANFLQNHPSGAIASVNYPKTAPTSDVYERYRRKPDGGYGSLISIVFHRPGAAVQFYDAIDLCKGPSFGTNFTLVLPYAQVAHAFELDWAESRGMAKHIVRISVGLEDVQVLEEKMKQALSKIGVPES